ncbi:unnamed protein product [Ectocarpus fasciculatus]
MRGRRWTGRPARGRPPSRRSTRHKGTRKRRCLQAAFRPHRLPYNLHRLLHSLPSTVPVLLPAGLKRVREESSAATVNVLTTALPVPPHKNTREVSRPHPSPR